jgi:hypothetical protein
VEDALAGHVRSSVGRSLFRCAAFAEAVVRDDATGDFVTASADFADDLAWGAATALFGAASSTTASVSWTGVNAAAGVATATLAGGLDAAVREAM